MTTLQDALGHLSPAKRELVRRRLEALNARVGHERSPAIPRAPRAGDLPLSFAQQRLWFIERLEGPGALYNEFAAEIIEGALDIAALEAALAEVRRRHEILRTVFPEVDGAPVQRIEDGTPLPLTHLDLQGVPDTGRDTEMRRLADEEAARPFDLVNGPAVRFTLLTLGPERHVLFVSMHHVVCDRWSTAVLVREVSTLYTAFRGGAPSPLPELRTQYADYAVWQRAEMETPEAAAELEAWVEALHGAPFLLDLPADRARPAVQGSAGAAVPFALDQALTRALNRRSRELGVTPFMTLHAALLALLYRYTGRRDIVIGAPAANRELPELEALIGFFVNTLPLRVAFDPAASFAALTDAVRGADADAFARRQTPLERLVQALQPGRSLSHSPLFQVLFVFQNAPSGEARIPGLRLTTFRSDQVAAKFDLTIALAEEDGRLAGAFEYSTELFDRARIERMVAHFTQLLASALADPGARLADLRLLDAGEESRLRAWSRGAEARSDGAVALHDLFAAQARRTPDAIALEFGGERLSYAALDESSDRLAACLRHRGVGAEVLVGVCLERSADMVVTLLAIHKAGGAYLPLDPAHPPDRLAYVLRDSRAVFVVGSRQTLSNLPAVEGLPSLCLEDERPRIDAEPRLAGSSAVEPSTRAYVIYTSGSTGRPKGVEVEHGGLSNLACAQSRAFDVRHGSRVLQFASLSFDASISEIAMTLCSGATLVIASAEQLGPGAELQQTLIDRAITHVTLPPAALTVMSPEALPGLRTLIVAGEACPGDIAAAWARGRQFFNAYGPTETTVCATICDYPGSGVPTLGIPMDGVQVYVVDTHLSPAPIGIPGELCIGGAGVARGYLSRPDLTAAHFVPDPFGDVPGSRLYRSGDLARFGDDGTIEFLGRVDHQVKIRGFRIELDEVARALEAHPAVRQAVVSVIERAGDRRLAAYYVEGPTDAGHDEGSDVRAFLARTLPEYMLPAVFVRLDELPLTSAGKVDRERLPQPDDAPGEANVVRDGIEAVVAELFRQVLGSSRVGPRGNFFEAGGHSLLAVRLLARIRDTWAIEIGLREFFATPTIQAVAGLVREAMRSASGTSLPPIEPVDRRQPIPLSFAQRRLWFLDQLEGPNATYNIAAALRLEGAVDVDALRRSVALIVERHESLRTIFPAVDGVPVQRIAAAPAEVLVVGRAGGPDGPTLRDASKTVAREERTEAMRLAATEEAERPFDLGAGPLFRARLIQFAPDDTLLLVTMHHIVSDGWSMALLINELVASYRAGAAGQPAQLPALPVQYADFAAWQQRWLTGARLEQELRFWRRQMAGAPALLELPTDRPRPAARSSRGRVERFALDADVVGRLHDAAAQCGATLFMTLMAGFVAVLARYSRQHDVVIGTGMANRNQTDTESIVGLFVNTLALRTDLSGDPTFADLVRRVRRVTLDAYAHQDVPFEKLVEALQPERSMSHTPLFQVMFAMQNVPAGGLQLPGVRVSALEPEQTPAKFDLTVFLEETAGGIAGSVVYSTDLFDGDTVARLLRHYATLLTAAAADAGRRLSALPLMDAAETHSVVQTFAATRTAVPDGCLHERFEAMVERYPARIAVSLDDRTLTYRALNARANRLARHLQAQGVRAGDLVGLCMERSPDLVVALIAILKAGAAYVPLDPSYPADRLAFMIDDSGIRVLVTERSLVETLPPHAVATCCIDADWAAVERLDASNVSSPVTREDLCYVIYTSGSTGRPKGALVRHRNVTRLFDATDAWFRFDEQDVWTLFHSAAFDFSVWEIWGPLLSGGRLVVVPYLVSRSPGDFHRLLHRERVTVLNQTPSAFSQLMDVDRAAGDRLDALRFVIFGGEALDLRSLRPWVARYGDAQPRLVNMYGITETTVHVTWRPLRAPDLESRYSVIGIPIPDLELYVLDERMQPVPPGVPGELYVGGQGLARGYLNRPDLTAERFVPNPFAAAAVPGESSLYRTGDMVRQLKDRDLEYLGRADHQIKIRGFRIEPGEIEAALAAHEAVHEALVVARQDGDGDKRLIAYVVPDAERARPLLTLLRWQQAGEIDPESLFQLPNGMAVAHLNRMETEFVYHEIFEERSYLRHGITLRDDACIVDVGANIGLFSLFAATACRRPTIYAFEPIPVTFACLQRNAALHGLDARVFAHGLAAEERVDTFSFYPNVSIISGRFGDVVEEKQMIRAFLLKQQESAAAVGAPLIDELLDERLQREEVSCLLRPLSDVLVEEGVGAIDLLKIDVEKSELDVLGGIRDEHWPIVRQVIVEVHGSGGRLDTVVGLLRSKGFSVAVDRDALLADTDLFNVYASRDGDVAAAGNAVERAWSSPDALTAELREHLTGLLPAYMVPSAVVLLDRFPLTVNGKIDRTALPGPQPAHAVASSRHVAPRDETETRLAAIFTEVLRVPRLGVDESFFDAGGHSLLATQVVSRIREAFRVELPLRALFQSPTVAGLAEVLRADGAPATADQAIPRRADGGAARLSFAQERLWFLDQLEPGNPFYNVPLALRLRGRLDVGALEQSLHEVLRRHEVLRARFVAVDGTPVQIVRSVEECGVSLAEQAVDLTGLPAAERASRVDALATAEASRPFDLADDLLLRVQLLHLQADEAVLLLTMHHIVSDGWSLGVLVHELGTLYETFQRGQPSPLAEPPLQYADFAVWQREWLTGGRLERQVAYWKERLAGIPPVLELPADRQRPPTQSFRGGSHRFEIGPELTATLRDLSRQHDATLFMTLLAVFASVLHRYTGQPDIVIGAPIANRTRREIEPLIGFFVNTLALRADVGADPAFSDLLRRVRETTLEAYAHQDVPFERLVDEIQPERDLSLNPLFQVMFALQNAPIEPLVLSGLQVEALERPAVSALFDLVLDVWEIDGRLVGNLQFNADLFDEPTIARLAAHYATRAAAVAAAPERTVSALGLVPAGETDALLAVGRGPRTAYPVDRTLTSLFEDVAASRPDAVAARHGSSGVTYAELNAHANRIAHWLVAGGVSRGHFVALLDRRGIDLLASMLGVLKAGAAFLPIDPDYPADRIRWMLDDSAVQTVITRGSVVGLPGPPEGGPHSDPEGGPHSDPEGGPHSDPEGGPHSNPEGGPHSDPEGGPHSDPEGAPHSNPEGGPHSDPEGGPHSDPDGNAGGAVRVLDLDAEPLDVWPASNPSSAATGEDVAYLLYTSGSTGVPKGALVRHDGAVNHIYAEFDLLRFHPEAAFLQSAPSSSDLSVWQFLAPGLIGGRTVIADYETVADPARLFALLRDERVTLIELVPVVMKALLDHAASLPAEARALPALEWAMVTGETVPVALVNRWIATYPSVPIVNAYGPTEAADDISQAVVVAPLPADARTVPIGRPLANMRLYVLDHAQRLVPFGVVGEICVSGIGVGAGYWQDPERTAAAFVANPYVDGPRDALLYRTGDRGRWRADGTLECLGRLDEQVKVRGFRIELGEIEGALGRHPAVAMSAVTTAPDASGERRLVAYVVPDAAAREVRRQVESLQGEQIGLWRRLHEDSYTDTLLRQDDPTVNVIGWDSNYTNEPLPEADMREYVDFTVERILALQPTRVLEIGCGTGLILFRLLPHCEAYCGTDLSQVAIRQLRDLQRNPELRRRILGLDAAVLLQTTADELTGVDVDRYDTAILPSVVQYFPSVDYLVDVLDRLFATLAPGGAIFIGDVRSFPLLEAFHLSVQLHKSPGSIAVDQLAARVRQQIEREQELAIDPAFFTALRARFPQISSVEVLPKRGTHHNEMTRFRYDVRIRTAAPNVAAGFGRPTMDWQAWNATWTLDRIREKARLEADPANRAWGLRGVANARVYREMAALKWMADGVELENAAALRDALAALPDHGIEPEDLWALEGIGPYRVHVGVAAARDGSFDVAFVPGDLDVGPSMHDAAGQATEPWSSYANNPLREKLRRQLGSELREHLRARVPQYMVPSEIVFLDTLPLTPAGKIDRQALPDPASVRVAADDTYVAPRTPVEETLCAIWSEVLGIERVGIRSNFFELGGHSLKATQVTSRILRDLHLEVPLRELFVSSTIEALAARIEAASPAGRAQGAIPRVPDADHYPLSPAQRRLWVLCQMEGASSAFGIPGAVLLEGRLSASALQQSLDRLIARHESLRTAFLVVDGEPRQRVLPTVTRTLALVDLSGQSSPDGEARRLALEDARAPFDLRAGGLLRASLLRLAPERHVLLFNVHHIVSDDWSGGILVRELVRLYGAGDAVLPPLPIQYRDYAVWQHAELHGERMAAHRDYWLHQLSGDIPAIDLPADLPRPAVKTYNGRTHSFALTPEDTAALGGLARTQGASLFMLLVAAVKTLLYRYTGQSESVVGFPIAGRTRPELEPQIGFFINMLALRDRVDPLMSFESFLQQIKRTATDAYDHQDYPFDRVVNELNLNRDVSRTPLFDVVVVLQNAPPAGLELTDVRVEPLLLEYGFSKYDLQFAFEERDGRLCCDLVYNTDLFRASRIRRIGGHVTTLVRSVLGDASRPLAALDILPEEERRLVLEDWSGAGAPLPGQAAGHSLVQTFERAVARYGRRPAVTVPGTASLTYRELNGRANRVAHRLRRLGVASNVLVGLCAERGVDMIAGLLGILKAGGAYVPLDPAYPAERLRFMLEDTGARALVTQSHLVPAIPAGSAAVVVIDGPELGDESEADPGAHAGGDDAAYVIYTSGSTGQPKGVLVTHANVSRLFASTDRWFGFDEHDVWTLFHSSTFDFSVWEIWGALLYGGRLVIVPREISRSPEAFHALVANEQVTVLNQTPSAFKAFMNLAVASGLPGSLRCIVFGGEALDVPGLRPWFEAFGDERPRLVNMYGITETTVHVTYRPLSRADVDRPASVIGVPIPDLRLFILDAERRPAPIGVRGELYVGGAGVARGYVNRPGLTAERFLEHDGQRLYRSGDLARFLDDGDIEYLGRADQQVKIRGFRIELGEIEAALVGHQAIATAVVIARRSADATRLVAYMVARGAAPDPASLRAHLQRTLPDYMVPSAFVALPALPLTANGKLDRGALPDPDAARLATAAFVEPQAGYEATIAAIVRDVLRAERVGAHDNFFDLGADSLLLAMAHTRLREALGRDLSLVALYTHPTVSALAASLAPAAGAPKDVGRAIDERAARQRQARRPRRKDQP
jgi:amino acid adenylation domain-containing protein/FkbM family methyltransferase